LIHAKPVKGEVESTTKSNGASASSEGDALEEAKACESLKGAEAWKSLL